ncbi:MAG TPA: EamA family transporter [Gemmatimonadaceae bacterium]|nr:EamA family transporter [Gemmatimonadaceae bacterium]
MQASRRGIGLALAAAVLFGASAPFAKLLLSDAAPQLLAGLLYLGSGLGLGLVWLRGRYSAEAARETPLTRRNIPWLVGAIVFGGVFGPLLLMIGLTGTPASSASLLLNLEGVFTALLAWFVFRENFDRRIALGMLSIVAGGLALSWGGRLSWGGLAGPVAVTGACFCWGIDNNLTQKVSAGDPVQIAMLKGLAAGSVNTAIAFLLGASLPAAPRVAAALALGFFSYGVSLVFFVLALRHLGTARTGAYFSTAPFVGAVLSLAIFRERPTPLFIAAGALMALGVWLHLTERHEHAHEHVASDHDHAHVHDGHHQHAHSADDPPMTDPVPHTHRHRHAPMVHSHPHYPDIHHRHAHD